MFGIGWTEYILIGAVALIVIGPKELPAVLRAVGQWTTKIRRMATEFQSQFQEAMREAEMADLKKEVDSLTSGFNPLNDPETAKWDPEAAAPK
jgi:sec-independent protein translocase protein TatB